MEQCVIRSLKAKYRKNTVQKIIRSLEKKRRARSFDFKSNANVGLEYSIH